MSEDNQDTTFGAPPPWSWTPLPNLHSSRKAVIVGISYHNSQEHEIVGSSNYADLMCLLLINKFKFPESSILMLTEKEGHMPPTKENIVRAMKWLVKGCKSGDSLFFYYIGHGSQQKNMKGEEKDGSDETLCPLDFESQGRIVDDEINEILVRPISYGVRLHALVDASHSGTVFDLPFICIKRRKSRVLGRYKWEDDRPKTGAWKGSSGGEVICISGCADGEAYDNTDSSSAMISTGALTICFINAIEKGAHGATYGSILKSMCKAIGKAGNDTDLTGEQIAQIVTVVGTAGILLTGGMDGGIIASLLASTAGVIASCGRKMCSGGIKNQTPQLTASEMFKVDEKLFLL